MTRSREVHDPLHPFGHGAPLAGVIKFCWCMCHKCWQPYTGSVKHTGRCVCPECPCPKPGFSMNTTPMAKTRV